MAILFYPHVSSAYLIPRYAYNSTSLIQSTGLGGFLCLSCEEWICFSTGSIGGDGDRRRMGPSMMQQYADNQQLFMGNLPHHATEDDLKVCLCH